MGKKSRGKDPQTPEVSWFDDPGRSELFLWRPLKGHHRVLLAGNRQGYIKLITQIKKLQKGQPAVDISCHKPETAPPAQWAPSELTRKAAVSVDEIERDFQKRVSPPVKFIWYNYLSFIRNEDIYEPECRLIGDSLKVKLQSSAIDEICETIEGAHFPMSHGCRLADGVVGSPSLWLSADWIGAE